MSRANGVSGFRKLFSDWWQSDRIRISLREGELLRLSPGALVIVEERAYWVTSQSARAGPDAEEVSYDLEGPQGPARLEVRGVSTKVPRTLFLHENGRTRPLAEDRLDIYPPPGGRDPY